MPKSPKEVEELKRNWRQDPCYDLEEAPGFEDYREELLAYRKQTENEWETHKKAEHDKVASLVCPRTFLLRTYKGEYDQDRYEIVSQNGLVEQCAWWLPNIKCCAIVMTGNTGII